MAAILTVLAGAASCEKDTETTQPQPRQPGEYRQVIITAGSTRTKTSVSNGVLTWSANDKLNIVPQSGTVAAAALDIKSGVGTVTGTFEGTIDVSITDTTDLYGWCGGSWTYNSGSFPVNMPAEQTYIANTVLGSTWRIPTGGSAGNFTKMRAVTYWAWDANDKGCYVFKPGVGTNGSAGKRGKIAGTDDKTKALLLFPAAGNGFNTGLSDAGIKGYYCSSTLRSANQNYAHYLRFESSVVYPETYDHRYSGFSVRPVSD